MVQFPGELMRCLVERVVDANRVLIEIDVVPMSKAHTYRKGDKTGARRRREFGRDVWEALDDRDFIANRSPAEPLVVAPEPEMVVKKPAVVRKRAGKGKR